MATRSDSETKRVRYLLGLSFPAEREQIESEYFEDDDVFQKMLTAEDDLIDAYTRDELGNQDRLRFQKRFVSSLRGRDRVQFARAFANGLSTTQPVETKFSCTLQDFFKTFQSCGLVRTATIVTVIVLVAALAWLVIDRRNMTNELRELRAESAEFIKRSATLQRNSDTELERAREITAQLTGPQAQPDKPRNRERWTKPIRRSRDLFRVKNDFRRIINLKPPLTEDGSLEPADTQTDREVRLEVGAVSKGVEVTWTAEAKINSSDASLGNSPEGKHIKELPLDANNVVGLLSLQPAVSGTGLVNGERTDQSNAAFDGTAAIFRKPGFLGWIRFEIGLEAIALYDDYCVTLETADGRPLASVNWIGPLIPNQTIIDTPLISIEDLPSDDYVLLLMGKKFDGSLVKISEYAFKVIKY